MPSSKVLLDTNILIRASSPGDPRRAEAIAAIRKLQTDGVTICICAQNMQEYRQVATRSQEANGLGMTSADVALALNDFERAYEFVPDTTAVYHAWRRIVETVGAIGRANYDARIVAMAEANAIPSVLTYESNAFQRYGTVTGVTVLDPSPV